MKRYDLINWFIREYGYKSYLEIGIDKPANCFDRIECAFKCGVDPAVGKTSATPRCEFYRETSDKFFEHNKYLFDIVFVDGLHTKDQATRDIYNSLDSLSCNGTVIVHDCMPTNAAVADELRQPGRVWYGTVWQAWARLRSRAPWVSMRCVDADCGLGIVRVGVQDLYTGPLDTWDDYVNNRAEILQAIKPEQVPEMYACRK